VGILWGLLDEAGQEVGRHLVLTHLEGAAVGVAPRPARVVPSRDAHVRVAELAAHVAELDPGREELPSMRSRTRTAPMTTMGIPRHPRCG